MTRFAPQWLDEPNAYSSSMDRRLIRSVFPANGVRGMIVTVVPGTMQVAIGAGACIILTDNDGAVHCATDGLGETLTMRTLPGGQGTWDQIVAEYFPATGDWNWTILEGGPAGELPPVGANQVLISFVRLEGGQAFLDPDAVLRDERTLPMYARQPPVSGLAYGRAILAIFSLVNGPVPIPFQAPTLQGGMTTAGNIAFTIPRSGLYLVTASLSLNGWGDDSNANAVWQAHVVMNGAVVAHGSNAGSLMPGIMYPTVTFSEVVGGAAGTTIGIGTVGTGLNYGVPSNSNPGLITVTEMR